MASIALTNPFRMEDALLKLGTNNFEKLVTSAELQPNPATSEVRVISGDVYKRVGKSAFVLAISFAQDWKTTDSLSRYLYDNAGSTVPFELTPQGGGPKFSGTVVLTEASAGGPVNTDAAATAQLQCVGKPVLSAVA